MSGLSSEDKDALLRALDQHHLFRSMGVGFVGQDMCQVIRKPTMPQGLQTWIVLEEDDGLLFTPEFQPPPITSEKKSQLGRELLNLGISCGAATLAGFAMAGTAGAAPITAGGSTVVTAIIWAGSAATFAQCGVSTVRVYSALFDPRINAYFDSSDWYRYTSNFLDAVSAAGGVATLGRVARTVIRLGGGSSRPILRSMSRADRKLLARELAKYTHQAHTRKQFIRLAKAGKLP